MKYTVVVFFFSLLNRAHIRTRTLSNKVEARYKLSSVGTGGKAQKRLRLPNEDKKAMTMGGARVNVGNIDDTGDVQTTTNCTTVVYAMPEEDRVVVGYLNEWINAYSFISSKYNRNFENTSPKQS